MKIFITGATGFIGSHLLSQSLAAGHKVFASRQSSQSFPRLSLGSQPIWFEKKILQLTADDLAGIDVIIHLAATGVSPRVASWSELNETNIKGTIHMCSLAKQIGSGIIIAGSYSEYGQSASRYALIPPDAPLEPTFPYAASKAACSVIATSFARSEGISLSYLRIFNAFGEGQHESNLWPSLRKAAREGRDFSMTPGQQIRDFIPVERVAEAFIAQAKRQIELPGTIVLRNIGSGNPQTILQFCQYWWKKWQAKGTLLVGSLPYRDSEVMRYVPLI